MNPIELSLFASRIDAICEEMGAVLRRTSFSPNIRDRLDFSCAIFDAQGELCAQAAHIPVHLGSMAYAMGDLVRNQSWEEGDMLVLNDPYQGGTHLPDVTMIAPFFMENVLIGFVVNRAHHADIGAESPGSMPISRSLDEEGLLIPPTYLVKNHQVVVSKLTWLTHGLRNPQQAWGDFSAQMSANRTGLKRLYSLVSRMGVSAYQDGLCQLNDYAQRLAQTTLTAIPDGTYVFQDYMDDDGVGGRQIMIGASVRVQGHRVEVDFSASATQTAGNINCPLSVAAAAVYYVFRCLMPPHTPACAGSFRDIKITAPVGCLLNAIRPAAVAAGNVETSSRIVDVVCGALAQAIPASIPAASHGSMNNLAMGSASKIHPWDYYETIGGGMGASCRGPGQHAVQTHMTNTLNTPIEVLELSYPIRVRRYQIRRGSGGAGIHRGGDGVLREFEFLQPATATLLTERRSNVPWGLAGGEPGQAGINLLNGKVIPAKVSIDLAAGDCLSILTAGAGGWGRGSCDQ